MIYYEVMGTIVKVGIALAASIIVLGIGYAFGYSDGKENER